MNEVTVPDALLVALGKVPNPTPKEKAEELRSLLPSILQRRKELEDLREAARNAVSAAVMHGALFRPLLCSRCARGSSQPIEFHHALGYSKENWLKGVWLCRPCHDACPKVDDFEDDFEEIHQVTRTLERFFEPAQKWISDYQGVDLAWGAVNGLGVFFVLTWDGRLVSVGTHKLCRDERHAVERAVQVTEEKIEKAKTDILREEQELAGLKTRLEKLTGH